MMMLCTQELLVFFETYVSLVGPQYYCWRMADTEAYDTHFYPSSRLSLVNQCIVVHPAEELMDCGS